MEQPGFYYVDNGAYVAVQECDCHKEWIKQSKLLIQANKNNIWIDENSLKYNLVSSYIGTKSYKEIIKILNFLQEYDTDILLHNICMYIYGIDQTQKTTVAQAVGLHFFRKGYSALYTPMKEFSSMVCKPFPRDEEAEKISEYMKRAQATLLIIDDAFDKNASPVYDSGTQSPYIEAFLRERIDNKGKGVLFVSRVKPEEIKKNGYSDSLQSFVVNHTSKKKTTLKFEDVIDDVEIHNIFKDK
jgi:hypothetical protein